MALRATTLATLLVSGTAAPLGAQDLQVPDFVRLPGIYTAPEEPTARQISVRQVIDCVADDPDLHARAVELLALEERLERDSAEIDSLGEQLAASDSALRGERATFDGLVTDIRATDRSLQELSAAVQRLGADHSTQDKVERYNSAVDDYNREVRRRNAQLAGVRHAQAEFRKKIEAHNLRVREQHRRIEEYDARRATLRMAGEPFLTAVREFDSDCLRPAQ